MTHPIIGGLKPVLSTLALPPALPILLIVAFTLWVWWARRRGAKLTARIGLAVALVALWVNSTSAFSLWLGSVLLDVPPTIRPEALPGLGKQGYQAVVVLGGGMQAQSPEYADAQLSETSLARLRYGVRVSKTTGLPLAFSGGVGWAQGSQGRSEAQAAAEAAQEWGQTIRWVESSSRDTHENATATRAALARDHIDRIILVTNAWHMPRAQREFSRAGFDVLPAPMAPLQSQAGPLDHLPTPVGVRQCHWVWREWLGLLLFKA